MVLGKPIQALEVFEAANAIDHIPGDSADRLHTEFNLPGNWGPARRAVFNMTMRSRPTRRPWNWTRVVSTCICRWLISMSVATKSRMQWPSSEYALSLDPDNVQAYSGLAQVHLKSGRLEESLAAAEKALEIDPTTYGTHYFAARAMIRLGMREEGREEMRRYQELLANTERDDLDIRTLSRRAGELALGGEGPEAIAALQSLIETYPDQVLPRLNLGIAQRELGLHQSAIDTFQTDGGGGTGRRYGPAKSGRRIRGSRRCPGARPASGWVFPENERLPGGNGQLPTGVNGK